MTGRDEETHGDSRRSENYAHPKAKWDRETEALQEESIRDIESKGSSALNKDCPQCGKRFLSAGTSVCGRCGYRF